MRVFGGGAPADWLIVGLGNPGREHSATRHNVGFMVAERLSDRWGLGRAGDRFRGRLVEGRVSVPAWEVSAAFDSGLSDSGTSDSGASDSGASDSGASDPEGDDVEKGMPRAPARARGPRFALLCPHTYMNDAGRSVGPARGALKVALDRVLVVHDEIDLPFGEVRTRLGGGLAGHNGLKSLKRELGSGEFMRVRVGVGRPASTDPDIVSAYVLGPFREPADEVDELIDRACQAVERVVLGME